MDWFEMSSCVVPTAFLVTICGTIALLRWFRHREIMAMVEKGLVPAQYTRHERVGRGRGLLGWGIALAALGFALMVGLYPIGFIVAGPYPLRFGPWMLIGLIPFFIGLALLNIYTLTRKEEPPTPEAGPEEEVQVPDD